MIDQTYEAYHKNPTHETYKALLRDMESLAKSLTKSHDPDELRERIVDKVTLNLHTFNGGAKFSTWFTRVAKAEITSFLRERKVRQKDTPNTLQQDVAESLAVSRAKDDIAAIRKKLHKKDREFFDQLLEEGTSVAETQRAVGLSKATSLRRWHNIQKKAKEVLK